MSVRHLHTPHRTAPHRIAPHHTTPHHSTPLKYHSTLLNTSSYPLLSSPRLTSPHHTLPILTTPHHTSPHITIGPSHHAPRSAHRAPKPAPTPSPTPHAAHHTHTCIDTRTRRHGQATWMCGVSRSDVTTCSHMCSVSQPCAHSEVRASLNPIDLRVPVTGRFPTHFPRRHNHITLSPSQHGRGQRRCMFLSPLNHHTRPSSGRPCRLVPRQRLVPAPDQGHADWDACLSGKLRLMLWTCCKVHTRLSVRSPAVDATRVAKEPSTRLDQETVFVACLSRHN